MSNSQCVIHLFESLLGLLKEAEHNRSAELAVVLIIIHLQDLLEGHGINAVAEVWQADGSLLALYCAWSALFPREGVAGSITSETSETLTGSSGS